MLKKLLIFTIILLVSGFYIQHLASNYIEREMKDKLSRMPDIILDNIEYSENSVVIYNIIPILAIIILIYMIIKNKRYDSLPYYVFLFGLMQWVRGFFIIQTPALDPSPIGFNPESLKVILALPQQGFYPSGHTVTVFLSMLLVNSIESIKHFLRRGFTLIMIGFVVGEGISLLYGFGHYSVDISAAIFITYAVYVFSERYLKRFFT